MNLSAGFPVSPGKVEALLARIRALGIDPSRIEEQFIRGGGPGGQKINKTSSCVLLRYEPLGIVVRCQEDRHQSLNRFLALRELVDRVEMILSPATSPRLREIGKKRQRKARARRRAKARHKGRPQD